MTGPSHQTEKQIHEGTRTLQEIAESVDRERKERRARQEGFGKGMKHLGLDFDADATDQPDVTPRIGLPGEPNLR